jgi:3-oxoacyl-[acyl-carrier protein] reductase
LTDAVGSAAEPIWIERMRKRITMARWAASAIAHRPTMSGAGPGFNPAGSSDSRRTMNLGLSGKVALITGSSRGLGFASARALLAEKCRVTICARGGERLAAAASELGAAVPDASLEAVRADLTTMEGIREVIDRTVAAFGRLDILVNNVGLAKGGGIEDTSDGEWQEAIDFTLYPAIRASRLAAPHMRRGGGGVILMIASIWGRESGGRMTYNAVKAAEISLAKSLAQQLARDNIRVNSVAPGSILFPGGSWDKRRQQDPDGIAEFIRRELPFGRFGSAEEVANVVAFLASPRASWISGASIPVDGCQSRSLI